MPILKRIVKTLSCPLSQEQLEARGQELATTCEKISRLEDEKSFVAKQFKEKIEPLVERRIVIARQVRTKSEEREVECEIMLVRDDGVVRTIRLDSGELVDSRAATIDELSRGDSLFAKEPD
jgi:uncharacterized protein (UPF0335 family)